jgi:uncharacterized protein (TIGR02266 family)
MQDDDRRSSERVPARVEVRFHEPAHAARALRAYSLNLSAGGLCLRTERTYELGAPLKVALVIAGQPLELDAAVAWVRGGAVGVRFENLTARDRQLLESLVLSLKR